jgi:16S rRNA (guanine527-N7)-methyltransferase
VFATSLLVVERYAALLAGAGVERGLIGPRETPRLWERHLLNCGLLADGIPEGAAVCDIGSGAGLPGLVLAIRRPDLAVTLVEPLLRRATFLEEAVAGLGLPNVLVRRARAEELHGEVDFEVVTSRAVAPLGRLAQWSLPLVRRGGLLLAMKGRTAHEELATAGPTLRRLGAGPATVEQYGVGVVDPPTTAVRVEVRRSSPLGLPRTPGTSRKERRRDRGRTAH